MTTYRPILISNSTHITLPVHRWIVPRSLLLSGGSWPRFSAERLISVSAMPQKNMLPMAPTVRRPRTWCAVRKFCVCLCQLLFLSTTQTSFPSPSTRPQLHPSPNPLSPSNPSNPSHPSHTNSPKQNSQTKEKGGRNKRNTHINMLPPHNHPRHQPPHHKSKVPRPRNPMQPTPPPLPPALPRPGFYSPTPEENCRDQRVKRRDRQSSHGV